jgi:hypothetical protein
VHRLAPQASALIEAEPAFVPLPNIAIAARQIILMADRASRRAAFGSASLRRDCGPTRIHRASQVD